MEFRDLRGLTDAVGVASVTSYDISGALPGTHLGIPSPTVTVVVDLGEGLALSGPGLTGIARFRVAVGGLHHRPYLIHHDGTQVGVQFALTPAAVRRLFGMPVAELADSAVDLAQLEPAFADELAGRVAAAAPRDRARIGAQALLARLDDPGVAAGRWAPQPDAAAAWEHIVARGGRCSVSELTARSGWSARYLATRFTAEYGFGPKQAARLVRFDRAMTRLRGGLDIPTVAAAAGYADQSHFTRDFTEYVSVPPAAYLRRDEFVPA